MACLTEEFGFAIAPCFDGSLSVPRNCAAPGALEMCFLGLAFRYEFVNQGQDNNANNYSSENDFRCHGFPTPNVELIERQQRSLVDVPSEASASRTVH